MRKLFITALFFIVAAPVISGPSLAGSYDDLLGEAMNSFKDGKVDDSLSKIGEIESLGLKAGLEMAHFLKGHCYVKKNDNGRAAVEFFKAADGGDFPLKDYAVFSLARTCHKLGKRDEAVENYERLLIEHPDSPLAQSSIMFLAQKKAAEKKHAEAVELFDLIIFSPEQGDLIEEAKYRKAKSLESLGKRAEALDAYFNLAFYHPQGKFRDPAMNKLKELSRKMKVPFPTPSREELYTRAMNYYDRGDYSSASTELYRFLKSHPHGHLSEKARLRLAVSEYKGRRLSNAYYQFKRIINSGSAGADQAQYYLSFIYGRWGRLKNAVTSLRKVLWNHPNSEFADDAAFYIGYYWDINNYKTAALKQYEEFTEKYPKSEWATNAVWRAGKIYYETGKYEDAFRVYSKAMNDLPHDDLTAYCLFWRGMSAGKLNREGDAKDSFLAVVRDFDHTYYSYRARERLKELGVDEREIEYSTSWSPSEDDLMKEADDPKDPRRLMSAHKNKYDYLLAMGFADHAKREARYLMDKASDDHRDRAELLYYLAVQDKGEYREPLRFAEARYLNAIRDGELSEYDYRVWQLAYPKGFWNHVLRYSIKYGLDPYLVLAVIREESRFNPKTLSWARAHGLMQIIPTTGRGIARMIGIRPYHSWRLYEPETNIKMGCYYLSNLIKRFNGNVYLALAAYNGGPMRVKAWLGRWKRTKGKDLDIDEFVEKIPFRETRFYVKKVMKSYNEYKRIYESSSIKKLPSSQG